MKQNPESGKQLPMSKADTKQAIAEQERIEKEHEKQIEILQDLIETHNEKREEARARIAYLRYGIEIGSIVVFRGTLHRVTEIDCTWDKPWLMGNPMRKDGTFGTAIRHIFSDWELTHPAP